MGSPGQRAVKRVCVCVINEWLIKQYEISNIMSLQCPHDGPKVDTRNEWNLVTNLHMIEQSSRCCNKNIYTSAEFLGFFLPIGAAHDEAVRVWVISEQLLEHTECLHRQLTGRWNNDGTSAYQHRVHTRQQHASINQHSRCGHSESR